MIKTIIYTLFFHFIFMISISGQQNVKVNSIPTYKKNPNYEQYLNIFKVYKMDQADIVLLGNSIIEGGNWPELLGRKNIANRGIPGDILEGFLARISSVLKLRPKICIVMGGINDIYAWIPVEEVYKNYLKLLRTLKRKSIQPIIVSTLFAGKEYHSSENRNEQIKLLNVKLNKYAKQYNLEYIDLNKHLSNNGFLNKEVTIDGIHLNWKGYQIWAEQLDKSLFKYGY